jgi:hypothetical protein
MNVADHCAHCQSRTVWYHCAMYSMRSAQDYHTGCGWVRCKKCGAITAVVNGKLRWYSPV